MSAKDALGVRLDNWTVRSVIVSSQDQPVGYLLQCDCGKWAKLGLNRIARWRDEGFPMAPACKCGAPYPREYKTWQNVKLSGCGKHWRKDFRRFFRDMGPKPLAGEKTVRIKKRNPKHMYKKGNAYWHIPEGEEVVE